MTTKIDIFSGFLGAGKTTLIKKLIEEAYKGERLVLIENEFGDIASDGGFLRDAGIEIREMSSGCICCSLVGDFGEALKKVISEYHPDRILIEPSGVGKLSDVIVAVQKAAEHEAVLGSAVAVADASKVRLYMKNFGEFYNNQIETANCIVLSRTQNVPEAKLKTAVELIRAHNEKAALVTTPWDELTGAQLREAMEADVSALDDMMADLIEAHEREEAEHEAHHHHDHDEDEHHHHHHHDEDEDEDEHEHHHHHHHHDDDDDEVEEHEHHHHHHHHDDDDDEHDHSHCDHEHGYCEHEHHHEHHHDHEHHHHHHADEVFTSWGCETAKQFTEDGLREILEGLDDALEFGIVLRAKGIVPAADGRWIHFDYVPGEIDIRYGSAEVIGRLCVIGSKLDEAALAERCGL